MENLKNLKSLKQYNKLAVAALGVVLTGLNVLYGTNVTVQLLINVAVAAGVYRVPNKTA